MQPDEMAGQVLGHYRIIRPLGYGGTATVFLAEDINLQRRVAVKVFNAREGNIQEFLRRFAREARVLAKLDHPNILPVYDYGEQGDNAYIVMPYMAGGSLRDSIQKERVFSSAETVELMSQILKALQYAHDQGLIHRDIKPGNMLFKSDGSLLLSDFGLVKVVPIEGGLTTQEEAITLSGQKTISGTPEYMAPEQINGQAVPASDIYAIGVILYEMLTGQRLFTAENYLGILMKHLHEQPIPPRTINPRISPEMEQVILRALAKDPAQRYQRPEDMRQALQQALTNEQASTVVHDSGSPKLTPTPIPPVYEPPIDSKAYTSSGRPSNPGFYPPTEVPLTHTPVNQPSPSSPVTPFVQPERQRSNRLTLVALILAFCVVLASAGFLISRLGTTGPGQHPGTATAAVTATGPAGQVSATSAPTTPQTTSQVPPVAAITTACPATGKARAPVTAVTPTLTVGNDQNIIYIVNEFDANKHPTFGTVKRHSVGTGNSVEINKTANTTISEAQVSQDGQWVLFTAKVAGQDELRLVRVDGQGLQTLYCAPTQQTISSTQWSFNQKLVIFNAGPQIGPPTTYLLDMTSGNIQAEIVPQANLGFMPHTWLDQTHVYLTAFVPNADGPPQSIYVLDIQKGANQHDKDLQRITAPSTLCTSYDSGYDSTQVFISSCTPSSIGLGAPGAPSTITTQPALGGTAKTIFPGSGSPALAITMLRTISKTTLLLLVGNYSDDTNNGLWKINTDGTGLMRLTTDTNHAQSMCTFTQYSWSNVSLDGTMFALQYYDQKNDNYRMYFGSLQNGILTKFADINGTQLLLAGWTRL